MASILLPLLFIASSAFAPQSATRAREVALDREFDIKIGEQVLVENERLRVTFSRVAEDSRCPEGVQCIWAGNGRIVLRVSKARRRAADVRLNTGLEPKEATYRGYEVKLVKLDPYPKKEGGKIRKRQYVATLVVSRR